MSDYFDRLKFIHLQNRRILDAGVLSLTQQILSLAQRQSNIWLLGNGGSASTVQHFETDLLYLRESDSYFEQWPKVTALAQNISSLTAASNDVSFTSAFRLLLARKANPGDLVFVVSASGNSENLVEAVKFAKNKSMKTFALLGFNGGILKSLCDEVVVVESSLGEYGLVEDTHLAFCHAVTEQVKISLIKKGLH